MTLELVPWRGANVPVLNGHAEVSRLSQQDYLSWYSDPRWMGPPIPFTSYGSRPAEPISQTFEGFTQGMLYADGPVAAAEAYRLRVFGQAPVLYQEVTDGRPGDFFDDDALDRLRSPWPGATLSDAMKRALIFGDLAGNAFVVDMDDELVLIRPDWVEIVLAKREHRGGQVGWKQIGIVYYEGGPRAGDGVSFLPGEYAHFVPGLPDPLASYRGMSWLTPLVREIQADKSAMDHKVAFFENAASPNLAVSLPKEITPTQFEEFVDKMDAKHKGAVNAYKTLYTAGGADVTVIGANMQQMDFSSVQGKGETRIANAAGVPPVLLSFSEGMQGSSLNAGNYTAAKRNFVDTTMRDLWQNWCGSVQQMEAFAPPRPKTRLWYDGRDIPFLHEDALDAANIQQTLATTITMLVREGFTADSAKLATVHEDMTLLEHTGLTSVQLQPPGSQDTDGDGTPDAEAAAADEYAQALDEFRAEFADDDADFIERRYYDVRVPKGFEGGGRFRKVSDRIGHALNEWLSGDGESDDPLEDFTRDQLRKASVEFGIAPRRGASAEELKLGLLKDARARFRGARAAKSPEVGKPVRFTLTSGKLHDVDVGVYSDNGKVALWEVSDSGERRRRVALVDDLAGLEAWADEHGESELAGWARKERGGDEAGGEPEPAQDVEVIREQIRKLRDQAQTERTLASMRIGNNPPGSFQANKGEANLAESERLSAEADRLEESIGGPAPQAAPKIHGRDLDELIDAAGLRGKSASQIKRIAEEENVTIPSNVKTVAARQRFVIETLMDHEKRTGHDPDRGVRRLRTAADALYPDVPAKANPPTAEDLLNAQSSPRLRKIATAMGVQLPKDATTKPAIVAAILHDMEQSRVHHGADTEALTGKKLDSPADLVQQAIRDTESATGPGDVPAAVAKVRDLHGAGATEGAVLRQLDSDAGLNAAKLREVADGLGIDVPPTVKSKQALQLHIAHAVATGGPAKATKAATGDAGFAAGGARHIDLSEVGKGLGFDSEDGSIADAQQMLDSGKSPRVVARELRERAQTHADSTGIRYGNWDSGYKKTSEQLAERERLHAQGMDRVRRLRELADRLQATRRPTSATKAAKKAAPKVIADTTPERQALAKDAVRRYVGGETIESVAASMNLSPTSVRRLLVESGIQMRKAGGSKPKPVDPSPAASVDLDHLRTLDPEAARDELDLRKVDELKALLREQGLPVSGRKRDLVDRLVENLGGGVGPKGEASEPSSSLAVAVKSGARSSRKLTGGAIADVRLVTFRNGNRAVRKVSKDLPEFGARTAVEQADAEEATALVAAAMHAPVPALLRAADNEVLMEFVEGDVAKRQMPRGVDFHPLLGPRGPVWDEWFAPFRDSDDGRRLGLLDLLTQNWDRSTNNWMIGSDGTIAGIDHGMSFVGADDDEFPGWHPLFGTGLKPSQVPPSGVSSPFSLAYAPASPRPGEYDRWPDNDLTPADITYVRQRLAALRPEFERMGRLTWWEFMSRRLLALGEHATGTRNRIAP